MSPETSRIPFVISYTAMPGFFHDFGAQSPIQPITNAVPRRFGLIDFRAHIQRLNGSARSNEHVLQDDLGKLKYGQEAWDMDWSLIDGDGDLTWGNDPSLTDAGKRHAVEIQVAWMAEITSGIPFPESVYCSPLRRATETA
ncbi:hypothetical protein B0H10DRAFT_2096245 [Mycena sp. CBHHK59/15]|nr:hypothetical protein B0H10DRAFT_2096245 [Mycena sp. CBHHK59/15]